MRDSKIEWTKHTFNPWVGCTKVSAGCTNCYAETLMDKRIHLAQWGDKGTRVVKAEAGWREPVNWNRDAEKAKRLHDAHIAAEKMSRGGEQTGQYGFDAPTYPPGGFAPAPFVRPRVFCASLADVFEDWTGPISNSQGKTFYRSRTGGWLDSGPSQFSSLLTMQDVRERLFALIDATPNLDWLLLTKRPENIARMWPSADLFEGHVGDDKPAYWPSVWIGTSVEDQKAKSRIDVLRKVPAKVRFLSIEPLLENLGTLDLAGIHWVIVGGESGPPARPIHPAWARSIRDQCQAAGVPFFFKQWGEWSLSRGDIMSLPQSQDIDGRTFWKIGKKAAGRLLDSREWNEVPA